MKKLNSLILISFSSIIMSCTSTKITSTWRNQDNKIVIEKLNKVLVVAMFKDETSNRKAEDQMVSYLQGKGIPSYNYLNANFNKKNVEVIQDKIKKDGFDAAVTMRLIDVDKEKIYTPAQTSFYPDYYRNFSGYYYNRFNYNTNPGYYSTTKTYTVETNVYSIKSDKIIWSGLTESTNPSGAKKMTEEVAKAVYKQMVKEGFIK